ncbi:hypothetical protein KSP39_PZI020331 [Platanthera zijinensis]|uniref:Uncharacterized protein n=1 Tax=Platanthera zijinensis TaxID=2320716 RepID=A0AAP0AZW7_9ASPA
MNFRFQNILGAPYRGGNAVISDYSLLSPVGNRVSVTELIKSQTITLPFEATCNISRIALSPDGNFLLTVDDQSRALFVNLSRRVVLHRISFKKGVTALRFSSDGSLIAVGLGKLLQIWRSPGFRKEFFPFKHVRTFSDCSAAITSLDWSPDSNYIIVGSKDLAVRLFFLKKTKADAKPFMFLGHRESIVGVFFSILKKTTRVFRIYTISRDGAIFTWNLDVMRPVCPRTKTKDSVRMPMSETARASGVGWWRLRVRGRVRGGLQAWTSWMHRVGGGRAIDDRGSERCEGGVLCGGVSGRSMVQGV